MDGFLVINKPVGMSSFDVIRRLRKKFGPRIKMGHAGTLDPLASGVLIIALGKATKKIQDLPQEKEYRADIILGVSTTTDDREGKIITTHDVSTISKKQIQEVVKKYFVGKITQKPPLFSARHFHGQRLYQLARQNKAPALQEIPSREVEIYSYDLTKIQSFIYNGKPVVLIQCTIACSAGTYIRSLARDLGDKLGTGGFLYALVRTKAGGFGIEESLGIDEDINFKKHLTTIA